MKNKVFLLFCIVFCLTFGSRSSALGDPVGSLEGFIVDIFRLQIDTPEMVSRKTRSSLMNSPPDNPEVKRALHLAPGVAMNIKSLTCDDLVFLGYDDWLVGHTAALNARLRAEDSQFTAETWWPSF